MKRILTIFGLIAALYIPTFAIAIETVPRISDREIVERLTKLEEGQKAILREIDKRFEAMDKRLDQMINVFIGIVAAFSAIVSATIGFAIWDRRTMIRPFETKVKNIENELVENRTKLHNLIDAFRTLGKTDEKVADILKKFNLF